MGPLAHHAELAAVLGGIVIDLCGIQQDLAGDAALVEAGAAQGALLNQQGLQTGLTGALCGHIAAGAAAQDNNVIAHGDISSKSNLAACAASLFRQQQVEVGNVVGQGLQEAGSGSAVQSAVVIGQGQVHGGIELRLTILHPDTGLDVAHA